MNIQESNFKDKTFFITYNTGYAEKGIYETFLSYDDVIQYISDNYGDDKLQQWLIEENDYFELNDYSVYVIGVDSGEYFDFKSWSSQDW